ncbi:AAA ATPase-like domain-containing protein [Desulfonema limicola]|uniref:AAA ATPase-like domain-containing protein n=1 Tax=Desulfonema limicola TaxID=45656 RepID=A0A975GJ23_9BACT|nr:AAA family ATPase [Desulfonema limicola]QTA82528.1 AAA ATPase-like domain-containing protein [Desulfonema limicola]
MEREFNDTGLCVPGRHYMADISGKIEKIIKLIEKGKYFTINRPRQFGKTTILAILDKQLNEKDDYAAIEITFEEIDLDIFQNHESYIHELLMMMLARLEFLNLEKPAGFIKENLEKITTFPGLSRFITQLIQNTMPNKKVVLMIDEVDKNSDNQLFLTLLAMLRNKYLQQNKGNDHTFHSVILAGVHDIKTLKAKIRSDDQRKYNSPWNIASDFKVDLSFSPTEIETMLQDYAREKNINLEIPAIAQKLYYYTSGYPWLVSKMCKFIDEDIVPQREDKNWSINDIEAAFRMITNEAYTSTLFDSLAKNMENNKKLYDLISMIVINGAGFSFTITNPVINLGHLYGILVPGKHGRCQIHNRIFEQRIYAHIMSEIIQTRYMKFNGFLIPEFYTGTRLNLKLVLQRFQTFMKENYSNRDAGFLEREGRLLFLAYLRPIINGRGFDFKEPVVSDEKRMDIVITYQDQRHVIELKIWHGQKYHEQGLKQLSDYLDTYSLKKGYLLVYDFNKNKEYRQENILFEDKEIFAVWV